MQPGSQHYFSSSAYQQPSSRSQQPGSYGAENFSNAQLGQSYNSTQLVAGLTALIRKGNLSEILAYIGRHNLDVAKVTEGSFRHTCLYFAALIADPEAAFQVTKALVERGVPPGYTDVLNQTVLYYAAREGKVKCAEYLISLKCDVNHRDQYGQTPLYYAARDGHYELVNKLIQAGSNVNNVDANGQTALFYAAREGRRNVCELLINCGINVNKQDNHKQTALHWAKKYNRTEVVELLLSHGAIPLREPTVPRAKERPKKSEKGKKAPADINTVMPFALTVYKDGVWRELTLAEYQEFLVLNKDAAKYFNNPALLSGFKAPPLEQAQNLSYHWDKTAGKILNALWKMNGAWHFHKPVDYLAMRIPDYPEIVKHPMDFGTIKGKLATGAYRNCKEFVDDVELVFGNCIFYNKETSDFGLLAFKMRDEFHNLCKSSCLEFYMQ